MINVVMITENPIAGAPLNLCRALNKYQGDKVKARCIAQSDRNENRIFGADIIIDNTPYEELKQVLEQADVIHFHNFYRNQHLFRKYTDLWQIVMKKKRVWQVHSPRETRWVNLEEALTDHHMKKLVIGQYHPRQWPECTVVPNIIDIWDDRLTPHWTMNEKLRVAYSPSRIGFKGWDNKSYETVAPVLQQLVDEGYITAEIIHNVPYDECLARRSKADVVIDEISTGSFHLVSLESLSAGLVTIAGLDRIQIDTLLKLTGSSEAELPWVIARDNEFSLKRNLVQMADNYSDVVGHKYKSRNWMERYWEPADLTQQFVDIYNTL